MDKKPIALNFFNNNKQSWKVLLCLNETTVQRNGKGTVLETFIHLSNEKEYSESTKYFDYNSIKYEAYSLTNSNKFENYSSMKIMVEFFERIPDRVYLNHVSITVLPYVLPPKRCFICQRYGHDSISCRRKIACAYHFHTECKIPVPSLFKCVSCDEKHKPILCCLQLLQTGLKNLM